MDPLKLLESIEEVLYRTALWVLLIPNTIITIVCRPYWIFSYVTEELEKEAGERFTDKVSPVLLWALVALSPYVLVLDFLAKLSDSRVAKEVEWKALTSAPWSTRLIVVAVVALAGPLAFAKRSLLDLKISANRDTLRGPFFIQCYCFTPAYVALLPAVYLTLRYDAVPEGASQVLFGASWLTFAVLLLNAETAVLSAHLGISRRQAVFKTFSYFLSVFIMLIVLEMFVITLRNGIGVWAGI
jgi:hypothetical protein